MNRLRGARVLISGMGSLGVEVAKNLILAGVSEVVIHETKTVKMNDLSAQVTNYKHKHPNLTNNYLLLEYFLYVVSDLLIGHPICLVSKSVVRYANYQFARCLTL